MSALPVVTILTTLRSSMRARCASRWSVKTEAMQLIVSIPHKSDGVACRKISRTPKKVQESCFMGASQIHFHPYTPKS